MGVERVHAAGAFVEVKVVVDGGAIADGNRGFVDKVGEAVADAQEANAGSEATELAHAEDEGVELHVVEGNMGVERRIFEDAIPCATSSV